MVTLYTHTLDLSKPEAHFTSPFVASPIRPSTLAVMKTQFHLYWDAEIQRWWYFDREPFNACGHYCYGFGKTREQAKAMYELRKLRWKYNEDLMAIYGVDMFDFSIYPPGELDPRNQEILPVTPMQAVGLVIAPEPV